MFDNVINGKNFLNQYLYDPYLEKTFILLESDIFNKPRVSIIFISAKYDTYKNIHHFNCHDSENKYINLVDIITVSPIYLHGIMQHCAAKNLFGPFKFTYEEEIIAKLDTIFLLQ